MALVIIDQSGLLKSDEILQGLNYTGTERADALPSVHVFAADTNNRGAWTLLPLFSRFQHFMIIIIIIVITLASISGLFIFFYLYRRGWDGGGGWGGGGEGVRACLSLCLRPV